MAKFALGWTDAFGTSGKSNMLESESESNCSFLGRVMNGMQLPIMFSMLIFDELKTGVMLWIHLSSQSSTISCHCRSAFFAISWMVGITKTLNFILMYHFHYDANTTIYLITVFLLFQMLISQAHLHSANQTWLSSLVTHGKPARSSSWYSTYWSSSNAAGTWGHRDDHRTTQSLSWTKTVGMYHCTSLTYLIASSKFCQDDMMWWVLLRVSTR